MDMDQQVKFFANMFNTDYNYARQCLKDVSEFMLAAIECGETILFPGCFKISVVQTKEMQRYNFKTKEMDTVPSTYKLKMKFLPKIEQAALKESALKRYTVTQEETKAAEEQAEECFEKHAAKYKKRKKRKA